MAYYVPYRVEEGVERDAAALLAEYERRRGIPLQLPIPVEDILEKYLKLGIEFDDMHALYNMPRPLNGEPEILGAIYADGRIVIDVSLDPEEYPFKEGRYRYTLAHEVGHWRLHRHLIKPDTVQSSFFRVTGQSNATEWQADFYASCLLMPKGLVLSAWKDLTGSSRPRAIHGANRLGLFADIEDPRPPRTIAWSSHSRPQDAGVMLARDLEEMGRASDVLRAGTIEGALEAFCRSLANRFGVSSIAMRVRLEKLGLLLRNVPHRRLLVNE